jgi:hypothetical protein
MIAAWWVPLDQCVFDESGARALGGNMPEVENSASTPFAP